MGKSGRESGKLSSIDLGTEEKWRAILAIKAYDFALQNHETNSLRRK